MKQIYSKNLIKKTINLALIFIILLNHLCLGEEKTLFQSCHILHKQGKYYIVHFKELFALDGKTSNFSENDEARRNTVANLLSEWELISLAEPEKSAEPTVPLSQLKILSFKEKDEWELTPKYNIGNKKEADGENVE